MLRSSLFNLRSDYVHLHRAQRQAVSRRLARDR